jgi:HEAT repeat protein
MPRTLLAIVTALSLGIVACRRQPPVAKPTKEPTTLQSTESPPASAPTGPTPAVSSAPLPASAPTTDNTSRLRELVAGYLESDGHGGWRKNEKVATELEKLTAEETSQIWPLMKDQQANIRRGAAVFLLAQFDEANSRQIEAFTALLGDSDGMMRARGLDAARQFLLADKIAALPNVAALLETPREERAENRAAAARFCGSLKSDAREALTAIERAAVFDPDAKVRSAATTAAAQIAEPRAAADLFKKVLADKDGSVRLVAAARLRQLGPAAAPAAAELADLLSDTNKDVAEAAAEALIRVGQPACEPLAAQLSSSSVSARRLALACLAKLGPIAKPAAGRIEKCKQDPDSEVRQLAEVALKHLGPP